MMNVHAQKAAQAASCWALCTKKVHVELRETEREREVIGDGFIISWNL